MESSLVPSWCGIRYGFLIVAQCGHGIHIGPYWPISISNIVPSVRLAI
jgi:hypothetical protein